MSKTIFEVHGWSLTKLMFLIAKKIESSEYISKITKDFNKDTATTVLHFSPLYNVDLSDRRRPARIGINYDYDKTVYIEYTEKSVKIQTTLVSAITEATKTQFSPFLDHCEDQLYKSVTITGSLYVDHAIHKCKNEKDFLMNVQFLELIEQNNIFSLLVGINNFDFSNQMTLNLNDFGKWKRYYDVLLNNLKPPTQEIADKVISALTFYKSLVSSDRIKSIGMSISNNVAANILGQSYNYISISYFGLGLIKSHAYEKFKWMFHPGFALLCLLLEHSDNIDALAYATEKSIFKRI